MRYRKGLSSVWILVTGDVHHEETVDAPQRSLSLVSLFGMRWKRRIPYRSLFIFIFISFLTFPSQSLHGR
ncbi:hypothetical protein BDV37DRAFT_237544 [Aspergillus pseudonomiae]|uniref:Uncharacterized protein n=1 Tax=Aspergillus pseudonomiae TaxID=1506151 RepID=A0A5N7DTS4_9EURO|nr:uncharacterized protein BDV37DRAFT_237544 [Aspergillus pseudonomiae]KAE8408918.1 hypothetical protein BDV37DRAFT_237544 [Aspergillus pseudonomiae]